MPWCGRVLLSKRLGGGGMLLRQTAKRARSSNASVREGRTLIFLDEIL